MKPTTKLLLIVVVLSFLMALVVGGVAVALDWTSAMAAQNRALDEELELILNAADAFTVKLSRKRQVQNAAPIKHSKINNIVLRGGVCRHRVGSACSVDQHPATSFLLPPHYRFLVTAPLSPSHHSLPVRYTFSNNTTTL